MIMILHFMIKNLFYISGTFFLIISNFRKIKDNFRNP